LVILCLGIFTDTRLIGPGAFHLGPGAFHLGPGAFHLGPGAFHLGPGAFHLGPGAFHLGPGPGAFRLGPGPGAFHLGPGPGAFHLGPGAFRLVPGAFHLVPGAFHLVPGASHLGPGAFRHGAFRIGPSIVPFQSVHGSIGNVPAGFARVGAVPRKRVIGAATDLPLGPDLLFWRKRTIFFQRRRYPVEVFVEGPGSNAPSRRGAPR